MASIGLFKLLLDLKLKKIEGNCPLGFIYGSFHARSQILRQAVGDVTDQLSKRLMDEQKTWTYDRPANHKKGWKDGVHFTDRLIQIRYFHRAIGYLAISSRLINLSQNFICMKNIW